MATIKCSDGTEYIVDDDIYTILNQFKWQNTGGYATTVIGGKAISMHRLIVGAIGLDHKKSLVDHINRIKTDNRRDNLRIVSSSQNNQNRNIRKARVAQFLGVSEYENRYRMKIRVDGKEIRKYYKTAIEAAREYDRLATEHYGDNAQTNLKMFSDIVKKLS